MEKIPYIPHVPQPEIVEPPEMTPVVSREPQFEIPQPAPTSETAVDEPVLGAVPTADLTSQSTQELPSTTAGAALDSFEDDPATYEAKLFGDQ